MSQLSKRIFFAENSRIKYVLIKVKLKAFFFLAPYYFAIKILWSSIGFHATLSIHPTSHPCNFGGFAWQGTGGPLSLQLSLIYVNKIHATQIQLKVKNKTNGGGAD